MMINMIILLLFMSKWVIFSFPFTIINGDQMYKQKLCPLTLALSFMSFIAGSWIGLPDANFVALINSPRAEATSLTALMVITWESGCEDPKLLAPRFTASANCTVDRNDTVHSINNLSLPSPSSILLIHLPLHLRIVATAF